MFEEILLALIWCRCSAKLAGLLPNKIQEREHISQEVVKLDFQCHRGIGANYPEADGKFLNAPYFNFNDDKVKFDTNWTDNANENYGSVSAFLPKFLLN